VILDLLWNADQHGDHSLLARRASERPEQSWAQGPIIRKHQFVTSQNQRGSDVAPVGELTR
jgi:hypothetical protein